METSTRDTYLETQVMTATPQKLRLMLIEGAIRFATQSLKHWDEGNEEEALESLLRCRGTITELLMSIRADQSEIMGKVAGIYVFLFQTLTEAQLHKKPENVKEVLKVLEVERETWSQVCEKMPEAPDPALLEKIKPKEIAGSNSDSITPEMLPPGFSVAAQQSSGGFDSSAPQQSPGIPLDNTPAPPTAPGGFSMDA